MELHFVLLLVAGLGEVCLADKTCYNCGYLCTNIQPNEDCIPKPHGPGSDIPFCSDHASMESMTKKCEGADECCGSLVEYLQITNPATNKTTTNKLAFHGCEKDLAGALHEQFDVICNGHTNACYNISKDDITTQFATSAEACFCDRDRCNDNIPNLPDNLPGPTDAPGQAAILTASLISLLICLLVFN